MQQELYGMEGGREEGFKKKQVYFGWKDEVCVLRDFWEGGVFQRYSW